MLALDSLVEINRHFGSSLTVADAYMNPTIRELAARLLTDAASADEPVDLLQEARLDEEITPLPGISKIPARNVMLTGACGFVGRFLLAQLLRDTDAIIYCLVRAPSERAAFSRLKSVLSQWQLWCEDFEHRLVAIPGDLLQPRLGLDERSFEDLCRRIDSLFHCATSMNHLQSYPMAKPANVTAVGTLLRLATLHKPKWLNYISTLGVFGASTTAGPRIVDEETPIDAEQHWMSQGYLASKWVAEKIFLLARHRGIPCNIFRLGLIWADAELGRYDELQREYRLLKSCLMSGFGIRDYRFEASPTPVDYAARAISFLAREQENGVFHISSPEHPDGRVFERCNDVGGTSLELLPRYEWIQEIKRAHELGRSLPIVPFIEPLFSMDAETFKQYQSARECGIIQFDSTRTHRKLERAGIVAPVLDDDLLRLCLQSMQFRDPDVGERRHDKKSLAAGCLC